MSTRKNLNLLIAGSLLLTLVSCGNDNKSSSRKQADTCGVDGISCLASVSWKIQLQGKSFPDKARVDINGTTVLNECVSKQKYAIDRSAEPQNLYLENFYVPKRGELKINVIDLGSDCHSESTLISDDNVEFEVTKSAEVSEILINL